MERDQESGHGDQGTEAGANLGGVGPEEPQAAGSAPAAVGDGQHRQGNADRICERHCVAFAAADAGRSGDDRGEDQAPAGHEDESERQPEHEPAAQIAPGPAAEAGERAFEHLAQARNEERRCDDKEQRDRDVAEEILREVELSKQP